MKFVFVEREERKNRGCKKSSVYFLCYVNGYFISKSRKETDNSQKTTGYTNANFYIIISRKNKKITRIQLDRLDNSNITEKNITP